jgi:hypothetical protein
MMNRVLRAMLVLLSVACGSPRVFLPAAGEDLYVSQGDISAFGTALRSFWLELGDAILEA